MYASEPHKSGLAAAISLSVVFTGRTLQPFIADLLSPRSESSCHGTIFYLAEDAPPDFLLSFAEDCGILIGARFDVRCSLLSQIVSETVPAASGARRPLEQSTLSESAVRCRPPTLLATRVLIISLSGASRHAAAAGLQASARAADGHRSRPPRWRNSGLPSKIAKLVHFGHTGRIPQVCGCQGTRQCRAFHGAFRH